MPVDDVPGYFQVPSVLADRSSLYLWIHCHRGMNDISSCFHHNVLHVVIVEDIPYEFLGIVRVFNDLNVLPGLVLKTNDMFSPPLPTALFA